MSSIRSNIRPEDVPALAGMLARKFGPTVVFTEEDIEAQPASMTLTLVNEDGKLTLTLVDGESDE